MYKVNVKFRAKGEQNEIERMPYTDEDIHEVLAEMILDLRQEVQELKKGRIKRLKEAIGAIRAKLRHRIRSA